MNIEEMLAQRDREAADGSATAHYRVDRYPGVAWWFLGPEIEDRVIEPDWSTLTDDDGNPMDADAWWPDEGDIEQVPTGMVRMVMVGDDREFIIDPDDIEQVHGPVCSCGQLGCGWAYATDEEEA